MFSNIYDIVFCRKRQERKTGSPQGLVLHRRYAQAADKTYKPITSAAALRERLSCRFCGTIVDRTSPCRGAACRSRRCTGAINKLPLKWQILPICHCEEADVAISQYLAGSQERHRRRRNRLQEIATAPLGPRNDKLGGVCGRRECLETCNCPWRSLSAATDAIGACHFNGSRYELQVPSRDCHVGLRPPRNDKLGGAIAFLTLARTSRRCGVGRGMPLPYSA